MPAPAPPLLRTLRIMLVLAIAAGAGLALSLARPWSGPAAEDTAGHLALAAFIAWAASPLAALAAAAGWFGQARTALRVFAAGAGCIALAGLLAYADVRVHPDAQGGLAFVFVPLVQWAAALVLAAACLLLRRRAR